MAQQSPPEAPPEPTPPPNPNPTTATGENATPPRPHRFFDWLRSLNLTREPGWIGGVAAGIAARLGIDVLIVRGILVVIAVLGGPAILLYAVGWLVLPDSKNRIHLEDLTRGRIDSPLVGIAILIGLALLPVTQGFWWFGSIYWGGQPDWSGSIGRSFWTLVVLGLLVWLIVVFARRRSGPLPTSPATTDDRPETIPSPLPFADEPAAAETIVTTTAPMPPPAPAADASPDDLAAWRADQEKWKADNEAFKVQQAAAKQAAARQISDAARAERLRRSAEYRAARQRTRSNPLYSLALVGVALIAGAITALVQGGGSPSPIQFLIGAAVAVGILGLGIIVNGALGRRGGGATAVAVILLIPLVLAGIFPQSNTLKYSGDWTIGAHGSEGTSAHYEMLTGNVTLDTRNYFSTPRPTSGDFVGGSSIALFVGSGNVRILVPSDEYVQINQIVASGPNSGTYYRSYYVGTDRQSVHATRNLYIEAVVGSGRVTIVRTGSSGGVSSSDGNSADSTEVQPIATPTPIPSGTPTP
jgi:phage shock protein PspC (stress-responsive transcriptional regulator)